MNEDLKSGSLELSPEAFVIVEALAGTEFMPTREDVIATALKLLSYMINQPERFGSIASVDSKTQDISFLRFPGFEDLLVPGQVLLPFSQDLVEIGLRMLFWSVQESRQWRTIGFFDEQRRLFRLLSADWLENVGSLH